MTAPPKRTGPLPPVRQPTPAPSDANRRGYQQRVDAIERGRIGVRGRCAGGRRCDGAIGPGETPEGRDGNSSPPSRSRWGAVRGVVLEGGGEVERSQRDGFHLVGGVAVVLGPGCAASSWTAPSGRLDAGCGCARRRRRCAGRDLRPLGEIHLRLRHSSPLAASNRSDPAAQHRRQHRRTDGRPELGGSARVLPDLRFHPALCSRSM